MDSNKRLKHIKELGEMFLKLYKQQGIKNVTLEQFKNDIEDMLLMEDSFHTLRNEEDKATNDFDEHEYEHLLDKENIKDGEDALDILIKDFDFLIDELEDFLKSIYDVLSDTEIETFNELVIEKLSERFFNDKSNLSNMIFSQTNLLPPSPQSPNLHAVNLPKIKNLDTKHYDGCLCVPCQEYRQTLTQAQIHDIIFNKSQNAQLIYIPRGKN
jgi:hypothetical protein